MAGLFAGLGLITAGLVLLGLAWRGSQRKLKRNHWVGIRTPSTKSSDVAWLAAHQAAAGPLGLSGGLVALLGVGVLSSGFDVFGAVATVIAGVVFAAGLGFGTAQAVRAAREVGAES